MLELETQIALLAAAVSQLDLALRESQGPVNDLSSALERMSGALASVRATAATGTAVPSLPTDCSAVARELSTCIESIQFYDRMTQHLSNLRDFIVDIIAALHHTSIGQVDSASWEQLRLSLRGRLISEAQRELLDLILPPPHNPSAATAAAQRLHVGEGSIELF